MMEMTEWAIRERLSEAVIFEQKLEVSQGNTWGDSVPGRGTGVPSPWHRNRRKEQQGSQNG